MNGGRIRVAAVELTGVRLADSVSVNKFAWACRDPMSTTGNSMRLKSILNSLLLCTALAGICGCSGESVPVQENDASLQGSVSINQKPAGPLCLVFYSDKFGKVAEMQVDSKGVIQSEKKIPAGGYAIAVERPATGALPAGIPPAYFVETSGVLRVDLQPGVNEVKLEIAQ